MEIGVQDESDGIPAWRVYLDANVLKKLLLALFLSDTEWKVVRFWIQAAMPKPKVANDVLVVWPFDDQSKGRRISPRSHNLSHFASGFGNPHEIILGVLHRAHFLSSSFDANEPAFDLLDL